MKKFIVTILTLYLFTNFISYAGKPNEFQFNAKLITTGNHPVYQLNLPFQVYKGLQQNDLSDYSVFNATGLELPSVIRHYELQTHKQYLKRKLPIFPINQNPDYKTDNLAAYIKKNSDGTIIQLKSHPQNIDHQTAFYLIDANKIKQSINTLKLNWNSDAQQKFHSFLLEKSNDLKNWQFVKQGYLSKLNYQGHRLEKNTIKFPAVRANYFRISWPNNPGHIVIQSVYATYINISPDKQVTRHWQQFKAYKTSEISNDTDNIYFKCNINALPPVDQIKIELPQTNTALQAEILLKQTTWQYNRFGKKTKKQSYYKPIWSGMLYKLTINNKTIKNPDLPINLNGHRTFFIRTHKANFPEHLKNLSLKLSWIPHQLLFIAQGKKPYTLAYGSSQYQHSNTDFISLRKLIQSNHQKQIKPKLASLSNPKQTKSYQQDLKLNQLLLWSTLLSVVAFLGFMTNRIIKQIKDNAKTNSTD